MAGGWACLASVAAMTFRRSCFGRLESGKLKIAAPQLQTDDPMMIGDSNSEALERYRLARAQREEIKLAEDCEQVIKSETGISISTECFSLR